MIYSRLIFFFCFISLIAHAQLQVTANNNATALSQTLQGSGVIVKNATLNCPAGASGTFSGINSNINITGGVLLTTGKIAIAVGPNNNSGMGADNAISYSDPSLIAIEPKATKDACILEFDATPSCDTLGFVFSFGSEEYPEYVNGGYNDVFGIFVSGANPLGAAFSNYNVALIPSTTIPVSINNVNANTNTNYFVNNANGSSIQYDGFTKPINVSLRVVPCTPYHFKLAIADASDGLLDSGVFFATQSLQCHGLTIATVSTTTPCDSSKGTATVSNVMGGVPPYSYSWNTNPVQTTASATGLSAGNYIVTVIDKNGCLSGTQLVSVKSNGGTFPASQSFSPILCNGDQNGTATVVPLGGTLPYTYAWSTSPVQSTSFASNLSAGTYTCITTDGVGCTHASIVTIPSPAKLNISVTHVVNVPCKGGSNGSAGIAVAGGVGTINYVWNTSPAQTTAAINNLSAGNYSVTVKDSNNCTATQSITLTEGKPMVLTIGSTLASCGIKDGTATVTATVGTSPYTYLWLTNPVQSSATATGLSGGIYTIIVTDANGCTQQTTSTITGDSPPKADFFIPDTITLLNPKMHFINNSIGNYTISNWKFGDPLSTNDSSRLQHPTHEYTNTGKYCIRLIVVDKHGICKDTVIKCLTVVNPFTFYVPNAFTPNDNKMNEVFMGYGTSCKTFNMKIFDRWGNKVFETNNLSEGWNGKMNNTGQEVQEDEFVWKVHVTDIFGKEHDYIGHIAKIK